MKKIIETSKAPAPIGPYSQAVVANGMLYVSGQIALDPASGELKTENLEEETSLIMQHHAAILAEAGSDFSKVVKCSIFLSDMGHFSRVNAIYEQYFQENPPARETVAVLGLPKGVNVEISLIAMI